MQFNTLRLKISLATKLAKAVLAKQLSLRLPETIIPADTRLNLNVATAEAIAKSVKGIGYATAKKIVELRLSLPGERFKNLDQLKKIGRVDWDEVIAADVIYCG